MTEKPKYAMRLCKNHGETEFVLEGRGYYRCKKCRTDRVAEQRRKNKRRLVAESGGECVVCGYDRCVRAMHFHHIDPGNKEFGVAEKGRTSGYSKLKIESDKCVLLCSNCHMEVEEGITTLKGG